MGRKMVIGVTLLIVGSSVSAFAGNCNESPTQLMQLVVNKDDLRSILLHSGLIAPARVFFTAFLGLAIISESMKFMSGQGSLFAAMTRFLVVALLLENYSAGDSFRYWISNGAEQMGIWIRDGQGLEPIFNSLRIIFNKTVGIGESVGWWKGLVDTVESGLRLIYTLPGWTTIVFTAVSVIVAALGMGLSAIQVIAMLILEIVGPFAIALGCLASTQKIAWGWVERWIEISLWSVFYSCALFVLRIGYQTIVETLSTWVFSMSLEQSKCNFFGMLLTIVMGLVGIFLLSSVPPLSRSIVSGRAAGFAVAVSGAAFFVPRIALRYVKLKVKALTK